MLIGGVAAQGTFIDQSILVDSSDRVTPISTEADVFTFDLADFALVQSRRIDDFELTYMTSDSCDEDVWVFNYVTLSWDQIAFDPFGICFQSPTRQVHLFSEIGSTATDYLSEQGEVMIRGPIYPDILAFRLDPNLVALPLPDFSNGLTYDGEFLWISSEFSDRIYRMNLSGQIVNEFDSPSSFPFGLAFDGDSLWLADGTDTIFGFNLSFEILCQFSLPTEWPRGLTVSGNRLWLSEFTSRNPRILEIDLVASCASGAAVVTDTISIPDGERSRGLAWDGSSLLVASGRLYFMTPNGFVLEAYDFPVKGAQGLAWDGTALWVINEGPVELLTRKPVVTKFQIPQLLNVGESRWLAYR